MWPCCSLVVLSIARLMTGWACWSKHDVAQTWRMSQNMGAKGWNALSIKGARDDFKMFLLEDLERIQPING